MGERKVCEGELIQVNEDGPPHWFRCILVVDSVRDWGVVAYCTIPHARSEPSGDAHMRLKWEEFDTLGVKSKFVVAPTMDMFETEERLQ